MKQPTERPIVETITEPERFAELACEWNTLLSSSRSNTLFLTWEWLYSWYRSLAKRLKLSILTVRKEGALVAIAPLVLRSPDFSKLRLYPSLGFLGTGDVGSDYLDFIIRPGFEQEVLGAIADHLQSRGQYVELAQLRRWTSLCELVLETLETRRWSVRQQATHVCPYIDLTGASWKSYLHGLGSEHRYNFHRRLRNLHKTFRVRFERVSREEERGSALRTLIDLHNLRWNERAPSSAFYSPELIRFHDELTRLALSREWLRLYVLYLNDLPAAALYGFLRDRIFYFYQSGFDPSMRKWSVGLVTLGLAIQSALAEGAVEFDLLHGDEEYKSHWANRERALIRIELYPPDLPGMLYRRAAGAERFARRAARRIVDGLLARSSSVYDRLRWRRRMYVARPH